MNPKRKNVTRLIVGIATICLLVALSAPVESGPAHESVVPAGGITVDDGRLTINVENMEITQLLRMLSVKNRVSIVAGPKVSGRVSVNLYNVTFDEALRSILDVSGYAVTRKGDMILVTEASEKARLSLAATDMDVKVFRLDYVDPSEGYDLIKEFVSPSGRAVVSPAESRLLVQDTAPYIERISRLIEQIDAPPRQVLIEAMILEISYGDNLSLGVQLDGEQINGETIFRALTNGFASDFRSIPAGAQGMFAGIVTEEISLFIEALSEKTNVKMLANPKILALDKQPAEIIIGDRLGFRITTTTQTSSLESVEFIDVGTQLTVTPRIGADGLILLDIHPEVSTGTVSEAGLPSESTAEVTTFMLVRDGQTVVLGGLLNETVNESVVQVPLLGDIPVVGNLFRKTTRSIDRSELVVLITPHIVGPEPDEDMKKVIDSVEKMSIFECSAEKERCD